MRLSMRLAVAAISAGLAVVPAGAQDKEEAAALEKKVQALEQRLQSVHQQLDALKPLEEEYRLRQAAQKEFDELGGELMPIESSHAPVTDGTPLTAGQILQAQADDGTWWAARVIELLPDGKVRVHCFGDGGLPGTVLPRTRLQLDAEALAKAKKAISSSFEPGNYLPGGYHSPAERRPGQGVEQPRGPGTQPGSG